MAIQELTQPIVNPIAAFDATMPQAITFLVIGGAQVTGNRIVISDNQTGNVVYNNIVNTMKLAHTIPANALSNGGYYNAVIYTIDNSANESAPSTPVPFYCYSQPTLTITNIPATETIGNGTYKFQGNYLQTESEQLNSYQFILYDSNKDILDKSDMIYYQSNSSLAYTFVGMDNDTSYYVELKGQTVNSTEITSGLMYFTVRYTQPASFAIVDLINDCENGYIQISSNIVAIDGKSNPEPPIYIDDKEVDLRDKDSWVKWDKGFNINNDFTMRVWGRDFNDYERIISLANKENTPDNPNKIEMKWMIADVLETLPSYTSVFGKNVAIKNGFKTDIKDLEVMGNSEQISKEPVDLGTGNYIKAETTRDMYLDIDVYGNSEQKSYSGKNKLDFKKILENANAVYTERDGVFNLTNQGKLYSAKYKLNLKPNTTYTIYQNFQEQNSTNVRLAILKGSNYEIVVESHSTSKAESYRKKTFTTDESSDYYIRGDWSLLYLPLIYNEPILVEGTNVMPYEPYTGGMPSPNPEYPQEIETVGSNVNEFDCRESFTNKGLTLTKYKDGSFKIEGTATVTTTFAISNYFKLQQGVYTFKAEWLEGTSPYFWFYSNINKKNTVELTSTNGVKVVTLNNEDEIVLGINTEKDKAYSFTARVKIEKGTVATPYSPYNQGSVEINVINKNFINMQKKTTYWSGAKVTVENNKIIFVGASNGSLGLSFSSYESKIKMLKGNKITYSSKYVSGSYTSGNTYYNLKLIYQDGTSTEIYMDRNISTYKNNISKTIILEKDVVAYQINGSGYTISGLTNELVYEFQLEIGDSASETVEQSSQTAIMPIQQEMLTGDYIKDVEHHEWGKLVLTGNETIYTTSYDRLYITGIQNLEYSNNKNINVVSNYFLGHSGEGFTIADNIIFTLSGNAESIFFKSSKFSTTEEFKQWLLDKYNAGTPVIIYYKLAEPINLELTSEQKAIQSTLKPAYADITNIYATEDLPILKVSTLRVPSPSVPSPIYSSGDQRNLLEDLGLFDISYTQDYFKVTDTTFKLKPNFVYNLSFDYTINNASTDLYFTVCYKNGNNITDITGAVLYYNQATGRSSVSFMVPEDIPDNSTLSVKFARTLIPANVNVSISNVQLEKGRVVHNYQKHGLYNIYPTAVEKNIFDYDKIYYVENKNTEISYIQNGISANLAGTNETAYIAIGFPNILQPGQKYAISYNSYGDLLSSKLYTMNKETGERIEEVALNNGSFTAPSNVYDFLFEFTLNDTIENNQVQIWNIQIETGDQVTEYEVYKPNQTTITLDQPLRAIGNYKDIICLESPNLLNPQTQIANVKGGQDYYFSQSGNTQYQLKFLTEYGNLISSVDISSGKITVPDTGVQIKVNASSSDITSNKLQINEGTTAEIYYPYVNKPSVIRYIDKIIFNGTERWTKVDNSTHSATIVRFSTDVNNGNIARTIRSSQNRIMSNKFMAEFMLDAYTIECIAGHNAIKTQINIFINKNRLSGATEQDLKQYLAEQYSLNEPVTAIYVLNNPIVEALSSENISALKGLKTSEGTSNVFTNNNMPANINFSYISGQSEQETKNAYITLKCWNGNVMPYFVHSNYIDIPKETDKVFIWVRKKNNIFDLKIENLGDYQGEET